MAQAGPIQLARRSDGSLRPTAPGSAPYRARAGVRRSARPRRTRPALRCIALRRIAASHCVASLDLPGACTALASAASPGFAARRARLRSKALEGLRTADRETPHGSTTPARYPARLPSVSVYACGSSRVREGSPAPRPGRMGHLQNERRALDRPAFAMASPTRSARSLRHTDPCGEGHDRSGRSGRDLGLLSPCVTARFHRTPRRRDGQSGLSLTAVFFQRARAPGSSGVST